MPPLKRRKAAANRAGRSKHLAGKMWQPDIRIVAVCADLTINLDRHA
jgi:hypothetical protein